MSACGFILESIIVYIYATAIETRVQGEREGIIYGI